MLSTTKNNLFKSQSIFLSLLILFPIIKIIVDSLNVSIGSFIIFLSPYFLKIYLVTCIYFFFIFSFKINHYQKITLIFFFAFFLLFNLLKFNLYTSFFLNITIFLTFSSFFFRWTYYKLSNDRLVKMIIPTVIFFLFFYGFYIGHFLLHGRFEIMYRHVLPISNPNYISCFISVIFLLVLKLDYKNFYKIILIAAIALIMSNLSSRSGSLSLFVFSFLSFFFIRKKIICFFIIIIISFSTYKSFENRGNFIENNFSLEENSRLNQFVKTLRGYEYNADKDKNDKNNKYKKSIDDATLTGKEISNFSLFINGLILNDQLFGNGFGIATNLYNNIYYHSHNLNHKITNKIKSWLIYPKHTSYNTLSNLYVNGGFFGIFIFTMILLSNLNFKSILKHNLQIQIYFSYFIIFISTLIIGASFPILENFPTFILLILIVNNLSRKYGIHRYDK